MQQVIGQQVSVSLHLRRVMYGPMKTPSYSLSMSCVFGSWRGVKQSASLACAASEEEARRSSSQWTTPPRPSCVVRWRQRGVPRRTKGHSWHCSTELFTRQGADNMRRHAAHPTEHRLSVVFGKVHCRIKRKRQQFSVREKQIQVVSSQRHCMRFPLSESDVSDSQVSYNSPPTVAGIAVLHSFLAGKHIRRAARTVLIDAVSNKAVFSIPRLVAAVASAEAHAGVDATVQLSAFTAASRIIFICGCVCEEVEVHDCKRVRVERSRVSPEHFFLLQV